MDTFLGPDVLVTTPFWPAYVTKEKISNAPNLRLILTAGVGSDHIDLAAACLQKESLWQRLRVAML